MLTNAYLEEARRKTLGQAVVPIEREVGEFRHGGDDSRQLHQAVVAYCQFAQAFQPRYVAGELGHPVV